MSSCSKLFLAAVVATVTVWLAAEPVAAQDADEIDLLCQTAVVSDDPAVIEVAITDQPDTARLEVRILQAVRDVDALLDAFDDPVRARRFSLFGGPLADFAATPPAPGPVPEPAPEPGDPATEPVETPPGCSEPGTPVEDRYVITVPDDEIGEDLRQRTGALPVVIDLFEDDRLVDTLVTALLNLDEPDDAGEPRVGLGFVGELQAELAHLPDQTIRSPAGRLVDPVARIEGLDDLPIALAVRPESLRALELTSNTELLARIAAIGETQHLLLEPWVDLDEEAWRQVEEGDMVIAHYAEGRSTIEELLGVAPGAIVRLDPDATPATVQLLRAAGANLVLLDADAISGSTPAGTARGPVHLLDDNGVTMVALVVDDHLATTLGGDDAELAVQRALAELSLVQAAADDDKALVVDLESIDATRIPLLRAALATHRDIDVAPLPELFDAPLARTERGTIVEAQLRPDRVGDLTDAADRLRAARADAVAYAAMITSTDAPIVPLRVLLLAAVANGLDAETRQRYTDAVTDEVRRGTSGITIVESDRITLTSRTADLPLTVRNEQSVTITADLVLRAEKLRFPDGDRRTVDLEPGDNELVVRVETRASGDARVTATLVSPDGRLTLGSTVVQIRSTALSGLGLLISALALAVLLGWWIRTVRRARQARTAATVAAAADEAEPDPGGTGTGTREET